MFKVTIIKLEYKMDEGKMRVWWMPQVPMNNKFEVEVSDEKEAAKIISVLADYDAFQFENKIKPDYSNMGGVEVFQDGEWMDWYNEEYDDFNDYTNSLELEDAN